MITTKKPLCTPLFATIFLLACLVGCGGGGTTTPQTSGPLGVLSLQWDSNTEPDLDHYMVYYDTTAHDNTPLSSKPYPNPAIHIPTQSGVTTSFTLQGLLAGQTYFVRVSAVDNTGSESPLSIERSGVAK